MSGEVDFQADETPEAPFADKSPTYAPPGVGETLGSEFFGGPSAAIGRAAQRGAFSDASIVDKTLSGIAGLGINRPIEEPLLSPDDINSRFAPEGTKIATAPMSEGLARIIGKQKQDEMDREATWARFSNDHSWPSNFAAGMAAFMLDPLNVASMFVPGIGEESILAGLGRAGIESSVASRIGARAVSGATIGATAQLPISAVKYGLGSEEASDYDLRAALKDVAFGAAGGAVLGGGIGALREAGALRSDAIMVPQTNHAAISAATSQIVSGRPVDVSPIVHGSPVADIGTVAARQAEIERNGYAPGMGQDDFARLQDEIYNPQAASIERYKADESYLAAADERINAAIKGQPSRAEPATATAPSETVPIERGGYALTPEEAAHFDRYANTPAKQAAAFSRADIAEHIGNVQSSLREVGLTEADHFMVARAARIMQQGLETDGSAAYERAVMDSVREIDHAHSIGAEAILRGTPFEDFTRPIAAESVPEIPFESGQVYGAGAEGRTSGAGEPSPSGPIHAGGEGASGPRGRATEPGAGSPPSAEAALEARILSDPHLTAEDHAAIMEANDGLAEAANRAGAYAQAAGCLSGSEA